MKYADSTLDQAVDVFTDLWLPILLVALLYTALAMIIAKKAGYSHWLGALAVLVPVFGVLLMAVFAIVTRGCSWGPAAARAVGSGPPPVLASMQPNRAPAPKTERIKYLPFIS